jgi:hypothetical protein
MARNSVDIPDPECPASSTFSPLANVRSFVSMMRRPSGKATRVLKGGGTLGAYQAGAYHALHEFGIAPVDKCWHCGGDPDSRPVGIMVLLAT